MSFTNMSEDNLATEPDKAVYEVRLSIVFCGTSYDNYTVWCLADRLIEDNTLSELKEENVFNVDPIAPDHTIDADISYIDFRIYGLHILLLHIQQRRLHWSDLLLTYRPKFMHYVCFHKFCYI